MTQTSHVKQHQLSWNARRGISSIISKAGLIILDLYFKNTGLTFFSEANAPFLNLIKLVPLVVPASTNMWNGLYVLSSSTNCYLSRIACRALVLFSSVPPLGIQIELTALAIADITETFLNSALGENPGYRCLTIMGPSRKLTWFDTRVDVRFSLFSYSL